MRSKRDDIEKFHDYDIHPTKRLVYIGRGNDEDVVDFEMSERAIKNLIHLDSENNNDITVILKSTGGFEYEGVAIYDTIKQCESDVNIIVSGNAMSMASIILQAGTRRIIQPNARVMIHYGTWGMEAHPKIIDQWYREAKKWDKWMEDLYLKRIREAKPRFKKEELIKMLNFDTIFDARKAVEYGLADEVMGE